MSQSLEIGAVRVKHMWHFDREAEGYVIAEWTGDSWAVPDWIERGMPERAAIFSNSLAANKARLLWEDVFCAECGETVGRAIFDASKRYVCRPCCGLAFGAEQ